MKVECTFVVNGEQVCLDVAPAARLVDVLRGALGLTGTKEGCGNGECGACTVLVDGDPVSSCLLPVLEVEGREVVTIEGIGGEGGDLSPMQQAFVQCGGIQCGFCTPGMIVSATALVDRVADPSDEEIRDALRGNLCRCTGYVQIVESVRAGSRRGTKTDGDDHG